MRYVHFGSEGRLVLPLSVAQFDGLCTQFEKNNYALRQLSMYSKPSVKLAERMLDPAFIGYRVQRGLYTILGEKKKQLYTCETRLCDSVHNSKKKPAMQLACEYRLRVLA